MSDAIKHECGIAFVRLLKPLELMEKQHNRGQDGAGLASIKLDMKPGQRYISRVRSNEQSPIQDIFKKVNDSINDKLAEPNAKPEDTQWLKEHASYIGEVFLGHVRYGTHGKNSIESVHPFLRQNNWMHRNLIVAGNFNMTNNSVLFENLVNLGQHPKENVDTVTVMEKIGHFLDGEVSKLYKKLKKEGLGHGDAFVLRDPAGIRPAYYYKDDEVVVVASERPVIQTVFNVDIEEVHELDPGKAIIVKKDGETKIEKIIEPLERKACSFERIYFSRGSDAAIYKERKELGRLVMPQVLKEIGNDTVNSVFSFIPNTAETSFYGMVEAAQDELNQQKEASILAEKDKLTNERLKEILTPKIRTEKIAIKDAKLRTFITEDSSRDDLVAHVYDVTYGVVKPEDNLVIIDDSIVRGTTLKKSIIKMMDRLNPKKIVVVSSAPQIRFPDCYGIDMANMDGLIAFKATIELLKDNNKMHLVDEVYEKCKSQENLKDSEVTNYVNEIYNEFTANEISDKISELLTEESVKAEVKIIYQTVENLHKACPENLGDWYFTGEYPTAGGNRVANRAFMNYYEGKKERAY